MVDKLKILVTGGAGFIGCNLVKRLLAEGHTVTILDNFDESYPREIKINNISGFLRHERFFLKQISILDEVSLNLIEENYDVIIHLAAKTGVRDSELLQKEYISVNVQGTKNMLEFARRKNIKQFIFASSSSVYGNSELPSKENDTLNPCSVYAKTKEHGEQLGAFYSRVHNIRFIALRFFSVYGPNQRPDLVINKFTKDILNTTPVKVFGDGTSKRDYTYIDDIVDGIILSISYKDRLFDVFNLATGNPIQLLDVVKKLGNWLSTNPFVEFKDSNSLDVFITHADITKAQKELNYNPKIQIDKGIAEFVSWFKSTKQ